MSWDKKVSELIGSEGIFCLLKLSLLLFFSWILKNLKEIQFLRAIATEIKEPEKNKWILLISLHITIDNSGDLYNPMPIENHINVSIISPNASSRNWPNFDLTL